jgi:hypothetical protein
VGLPTRLPPARIRSGCVSQWVVWVDECHQWHALVQDCQEPRLHEAIARYTESCCDCQREPEGCQKRLFTTMGIRELISEISPGPGYILGYCAYTERTAGFVIVDVTGAEPATGHECASWLLPDPTPYLGRQAGPGSSWHERGRGDWGLT